MKGIYGIKKEPSRKARNGWKLVKQLTGLLKKQGIAYSVEEREFCYVVRWGRG